MILLESEPTNIDFLHQVSHLTNSKYSGSDFRALQVAIFPIPNTPGIDSCELGIWNPQLTITTTSLHAVPYPPSSSRLSAHSSKVLSLANSPKSAVMGARVPRNSSAHDGSRGDPLLIFRDDNSSVNPAMQILGFGMQPGCNIQRSPSQEYSPTTPRRVVCGISSPRPLDRSRYRRKPERCPTASSIIPRIVGVLLGNFHGYLQLYGGRVIAALIST